jgi:16S rRNA processing protein RimM
MDVLRRPFDTGSAKEREDEIESFLAIGRITAPFGREGEVKVIPMTDRIERFLDLEYVFIHREERRTVENVRIHGKNVLLKMSQVGDRGEAERYRDALLYVDRESAAPLGEGAYYYGDLNGCTVVTSSGDPLGVVYDIQNAGSSDVYFVRGERGELLIPAVGEIVREIDIEGRRIVIEPMEGLL